jgi:hypothetical protein
MKYDVKEVENMLPFERDILVGLFNETKRKEKDGGGNIDL